MEHLVPTLALVGVVIVVASLLSGIVDRSGVPLVAAFLALGALLGPYGFGVVDMGLDSPVLVTLATLALTLVLFSDAVALDPREVRRHRRLAWRLIGPGTIVVALIIALTARWLLLVSWPAAALLGAAMAATDPVLLRSTMRSPAIPDSTRVALRLETGMNDAALLPVVMFAIIALGGRSGGDAGSFTAGTMSRHAVGLLLLGPAAGAVVGWAGIFALRHLRDRYGVRRDYESLYALGLAFSGYAAAELLGGSGFLAAFAAGITVALQDVELCDCFLEYGEATAEMLLLLTFVALGLSLVWTGFGVADVRVTIFAMIALFVRTIVVYPILGGLGLERRDRRLIALFGPRGLSTLLYVLLAVFAGVPGAPRLFQISCLVVLLSLLLHGGGMTFFLMRNRVHRRAIHRANIAGEPAAVSAEQPALQPVLDERITLDEVRQLQQAGEPVAFVDARAERSWGVDAITAKGAIRLPPDDPVRAAMDLQLAHHGTIVVYCA